MNLRRPAVFVFCTAGKSSINPAELVSLALPVPREPCVVGVIIDDLIVLERLASSCVVPGSHHRTVADSRMALADDAYDEAGLISNPSKAFQNEASSKFWGLSWTVIGAWCVLPELGCGRSLQFPFGSPRWAWLPWGS